VKNEEILRACCEGIARPSKLAYSCAAVDPGLDEALLATLAHVLRQKVRRSLNARLIFGLCSQLYFPELGGLLVPVYGSIHAKLQSLKVYFYL